MDYGWQNTVRYGVSAYSFLILGQEMTGAEFVAAIKNRYNENDPRTREVISALERHLDTIKVRPDGKTTYTVKQ